MWLKARLVEKWNVISRLSFARMVVPAISRTIAPMMNFVFTVCDNAANEACPVWLGQPIPAHWSVPDPATATGTPQEIERALSQAFSILERRILLMLSLPLASVDAMALNSELDKIGKK